MHKLQNKIYLYMLLIGSLLIFWTGFLYYNYEKGQISEQVSEESKKIISRLDNLINVKTNRLQSTVDVLFNDSELQSLLRETDFSKSENVSDEVYEQLDKILNRFFNVEHQLESVVMSFKNGGVHVVGKKLEQRDLVRFQMDYGIVNGTSNVISWLGTNNIFLKEADNQKIVSGVILMDNAYVKDMEHLANVYLIFSSTFFEPDAPVVMPMSDVLRTEQNPISRESQEIYIYDKNINHIYSTAATMENILSDMPIDVTQKIYETESGNIEINRGQKKYILVYHTASEFGWKFIRLVPYDSYYNKCLHIKNMTILLLVILFLLWCVLNYFIVRKIVSPLRDILYAMKCVEDGNLDITVQIRSKDEFYILGKQFNSLLVKIKELLERVRIEEQKRKESDILMLEYQMNPHFLHNTLAAIRMNALEGGQTKVAEMLLTLGRFLRNTITQCTKTIYVKDEIVNINDYLSLMQLRYDNQIKATINVSEETKKLQIPCMLLQPIIENALMHGLSDKFDTEMPACIDIEIKKEGNNVILSVLDNGKGMSEFEREMILEMISSETEDNDNTNHHIGLRNIHRRVVTLFGELYGISIDTKSGEYTKIIVTLPIISDENMS